MAALSTKLLSPMRSSRLASSSRRDAAAHRDFAPAELRRGPLGLATLVRDAIPGASLSRQ